MPVAELGVVRPLATMKRFTITFVIVLSICTLLNQALAKDESPDKAKKSFLIGLARLKERKNKIFNEETLPALKPIKDVQITSEFKNADSAQPLEAVVRVRIRVTKDSGHVKLFWFSRQDGKWFVTHCAMEPWESDHPPKVSIERIETEQFVEQVEACFKQP